MTSLEFNKPMVPRPVGWILLACVAPLLWVGLRDIGRPERWEEGFRIFLPFLAVLSYIVFAMAFNERRVRVNPDGVRVSQFPFPLAPAFRARRAAITGVYAREAHNPDSGKYFYVIGVMTGNRREDIYHPLPTLDAAEKAAGDIAAILNRAPGHPAVGVKHADSRYRDTRRAILVLLWGALAIGGVLGGAYWETRPRNGRK